MKPATRRRINRAGNIALKNDFFFDRAGIGHRYRRQQGFGVRMQGIPEQASGIGDLDQFANVHYGDSVANVLNHCQIV